MKKTFFILAAAAAALASCVKSEVVNVSESSAIAFDSFVSKETKATTITSRNELTDFWVSGRIEGDATPLFDNQQLTWNVENQVYAYESHKTWELGKTYRFAAYSDANEVLTSPASFNYNTTTGKNQIEISNYTVDDSKDLLAAIHAPISILPNGANIPSGRVAFQFAHMLTRVRFEVENTSASDIYITISDISFNGTKTGDCVYAYDESNQTYSCTWTEDETGNYNYNFGTDYISKGKTVVVDHFVIPQDNNKDISFVVESYVKEGEDYNLSSTTNYTASLEYGDDTWKAGWVYNYLIKVGGAAHYIHFDAAVDNWGYDLDDSGVSTDDDILIEK